jgi:hypothetical protein
VRSTKSGRLSTPGVPGGTRGMTQLSRADRARNVRAVADVVKQLSRHSGGLLSLLGATEDPLVGLSMGELRGIRDEI